jgi:hypothetical protein
VTRHRLANTARRTSYRVAAQQRERTVAEVFEYVRQRQDGIEAIERLDCGF